MANAINQADKIGPEPAAAPHVRVSGSALMGEVRVREREA
jgi:hypothetical protein